MGKHHAPETVPEPPTGPLPDLTDEDMAVFFALIDERCHEDGCIVPNPDDARQVETVAREMCEIVFRDTDWEQMSEIVQDAWRHDARAVLAALAELAGER